MDSERAELLALDEYLNKINDIMHDSFSVKGHSFGRTQGLMIMEVLDDWASKY